MSGYPGRWDEPLPTGSGFRDDRGGFGGNGDDSFRNMSAAERDDFDAYRRAVAGGSGYRPQSPQRR